MGAISCVELLEQVADVGLHCRGPEATARDLATVRAARVVFVRMMAFHLAQINIAHLREPVESDLLTDFAAALDPINALADRARGFVWRLQTEDGDATAVRAFDDDTLLVNMSVWESLEALADYVYRSDHAAVMRQRRKWFHHIRDATTALWWIPAGELPSVADAEEALRHLRLHGATPAVFTFRDPFPPPGVGEPLGQSPDHWFCPA